MVLTDWNSLMKVARSSRSVADRSSTVRRSSTKQIFSPPAHAAAGSNDPSAPAITRPRIPLPWKCFIGAPSLRRLNAEPTQPSPAPGEHRRSVRPRPATDCRQDGVGWGDAPGGASSEEGAFPLSASGRKTRGASRFYGGDEAGGVLPGKELPLMTRGHRRIDALWPPLLAGCMSAIAENAEGAGNIT